MSYPSYNLQPQVFYKVVPSNVNNLNVIPQNVNNMFINPFNSFNARVVTEIGLRNNYSTYIKEEPKLENKTTDKKNILRLSSTFGVDDLDDEDDDYEKYDPSNYSLKIDDNITFKFQIFSDETSERYQKLLDLNDYNMTIENDNYGTSIKTYDGKFLFEIYKYHNKYDCDYLSIEIPKENGIDAIKEIIKIYDNVKKCM